MRGQKKEWNIFGPRRPGSYGISLLEIVSPPKIHNKINPMTVIGEIGLGVGGNGIYVLI